MKHTQLKQLRMARGYSLADLAGHIGGIVTRQMLYKYERGDARPSQAIADRIADALGVKAGALFAPPVSDISCTSVAYRHYHGLPEKEKKRIEKVVLLAVKPRLEIQSILLPGTQRLPAAFPVRSSVDIEKAAMRVRRLWDLGCAPIADLVSTLEDHGIQVVPVKADDRFDGTALIVRDGRGKRVGWAVAMRTGTCAERQRLSMAHELGHLVMNLQGGAKDGKEEERAAYAFAGAFLAPADAVRRKVGEKRLRIRTEELLMLKRHFGMSIQALLFRLRALDIISEGYFTSWFRNISRLGWHAKEPNESPAETTTWLNHAVLRLCSERIKSDSEIRELFAASPERKEVEAMIRSYRRTS